MLKNVPDVATHLEQLRSEHARLESRLRELDRHLSLSPEEQVERARIKKAKLQLKDDILHLSQQQARA
ncbi:MAG TPA: YdcH family protein [Polyangia bacterium]|nr:YdcH family protein [Polyangia bacterium]